VSRVVDWSAMSFEEVRAAIDAAPVLVMDWEAIQQRGIDGWAWSCDYTAMRADPWGAALAAVGRRSGAWAAVVDGEMLEEPFDTQTAAKAAVDIEIKKRGWRVR
jgi:hypothetical protein